MFLIACMYISSLSFPFHAVSEFQAIFPEQISKLSSGDIYVDPENSIDLKM